MESTDCAIEVSEADEDEARRYFALWARRLKNFFPARWIETLKMLEQVEAVAWEHGRAKGRGLLDPAGRDALVARDLAFPRLGEDFEWTTG